MTDKLISDLGAIGAAIADTTVFEAQRSGQTTTEKALGSDLKTYIQNFVSNGGPPAATGIANVYTTNYASTLTLGAIVALRLYMVPVYWRGGAATTLAFTVTTAGAGGTVARLGLYNIKADGTPGTLIQEATSGATIAVDATGTKTGTISQTLNPGWYFASMASTGTPTLHGSADGSQNLGQALTGAVAGIPVTYIYRALGGLVAFVDETGNAYTASGSASFRPVIGLK